MTTPEQPRRTSLARLMAQLGSSSAGEKLYGRDIEAKLLEEAFERTCREGRQELILISGNPGTGKTALACTLRQVAVQRKGFFVAGKFEEQSVMEPYEVFIAALTDYITQLLDTSDDSRLEAMQEAVKSAIGSEGALLVEMIPALKPMIGETGPVTKVYGSDAQNRVRYMFGNFLRALAKMAPLALFLDDLQWADTASCELFRTLMQSENMPFLLVGAHRCDLETKPKEQDPSQVVCEACMQMKPFVATMKHLQRESANLLMQKINLADLGVDAIDDLLTDLFKTTAIDTMPLAEVILLQTKGNVFHILQFLQLLLDQEFATKNIDGQWTWSIEAIKAKLRTETIRDIVRQNILRLPQLAQEALKIASCIDDEVDDSALDLVLHTHTTKYLEEAANEGLIIFHPQLGGYRFAHDWIRQTAFEMIPKEEREEFHLKIGRKLWKGSNTVSMDKNIFVVVSLLNKGIKLIKEERERYKIAELNLQASNKAVSVSAFPDASKFLRKGIQYLGRNRWTDYYELTLGLYSLAAEVEVINGNYERVVTFIEEIVIRARCLEDKLRAYAALIRSMGQRDNLEEATSVGIDVLRQLGEPFPNNPSKFAITKELTKVKIALRGKTNQDLLNLPKMKDPIKIATIQILNIIFTSSYMARSPYACLVAFRAVLVSLKLGLHDASSVSFAVYAVMLCGLNVDVKMGCRFGELAISMAEQMQSKEYIPVVHHMVAAGVYHWTGPLNKSFADLLYASRSAMEIGDVETACSTMTLKGLHSLFAGVAIGTVEEEVEQSLRTARLYRKSSAETLCRMVLQMCQCYTGKCKNPARLTGDLINFEEAMSECAASNNLLYVAALFFYAMEVAYAFGDFQFAHSMAVNNRDSQKTASALFATIQCRFKEGLTAVAMARAGVAANANMKIAKEMQKKLTAWAKDSPQSVGHKAALLDAEIMSYKSPKAKDKVSAIYDTAIKLALNQDCKSDAALVCERYADYKSKCNDSAYAKAMYRRSMDLYAEWGATAKVHQLAKYAR